MSEHLEFPHILKALRDHRCIGRNGGRRHFRGRLAAALFSSGEDGLGGHGFRASRVVSAGDLQLLILLLLEEGPRHGYEIIKALEQHTSGFYAPSPGVIYPALTYLEEIGHASVSAEGSKKLYSLTAAGRDYLAEHRVHADTMMAQLAKIGARIAKAKRFFRSGDELPAEDEGDVTRHDADPSSSMKAARRHLRAVLHDADDASPEEQRRIIDILVKAAKDIRGQ
ncbi:PadR family transcriptional regulator [Ferrovibrio sp.]|uniref:PadR family transcriptional regulator n=1 Tax=Ferrovibrio sp. TaxID=1917215 RepID=UPI000CB49702|nr:PadR family transcriptional regulator [Ferrovibrio sp.]PJI38473.1 MAG: PadR family transcriptional regulator [Ferrovibrio sp.]